MTRPSARPVWAPRPDRVGTRSPRLAQVRGAEQCLNEASVDRNLRDATLELGQLLEPAIASSRASVSGRRDAQAVVAGDDVTHQRGAFQRGPGPLASGLEDGGADLLQDGRRRVLHSLLRLAGR